ncbi:MAG: aminoglycoside phosphotransferase family protein [Gammaproteobacteria bacterium]|nr:MAG: aminoglycoside phosphotransferase family protein [Gammaproteobacteria bacterium]
MNFSPTTQLKESLNCQKIQLLKKQGGGNSCVFCVEADGKKWAVKTYPPDSTRRNRLSIELMTYQFLNQHQISAVPSLKAHSESERWLIMDWVEGESPWDYTVADIEQAVQFIRAIASLNSSPEAITLPLASEACLSLVILTNQIQQRVQRLVSSAEHHEGLHDFLFKTFQPTFEYYQQRAIKGYHEHHLAPEAELAQSKRSLIPADFGFHNSIRDETGKLYFIDFDYFGWDDPVKLLADTLWHPKMALTQQQKKQFIQAFAEIYQNDSSFFTRFHYLFPLLGVRWVLILLNEFIPVYWLNRQHAGAHQNQAEARETQLKRAKKLLENVQQVESFYEYINTAIQ